jgi:hypothetical protein
MAAIHDVIGNTGTGTTSRTYTFTDGPTVAFGAPSVTRVRTASAAVTIVATFTGAASAPTLNSTTVGLTTTSGATCPSISGSGVTSSSGTINLSGCTGNGTVAVHLNAGSLVSGIGIPNIQSSDSTAITVDNTAPTLSSLTPATATVGSMPTSIVATFDEAMDPTSLANTDFVLTGTCGTPPTRGAPVMSVGDTVATTALTGGSCAHGETLIVTFTPSSATDAVGNAGTGAALVRTYTFDLVGPTIGFAAPSVSTVRAGSAAATIVATFTGGTTTPTLDASSVGLTSTGGATCGTISGTGVTSSGGTINLSNCTGNGTVAAHINAAVIQDGVGNNNLLSSDSSTITVDNLGPTVTVTGVLATNSTVTATFSEPVSTMTSGKFSVSGCTVDPVVTNFNANGSSDVFTIDLDDSSASCLPTETLTVSVNAATVTDVIGNTGTGTDSDSFTVP